jgi:tetratricopeptide (TPR) repeat protein
MTAEQALRSLPPEEDGIDVEKNAMALAAEGERLFGSERYEEALAAYWRAIEISRSLACADHYGYALFLAPPRTMSACACANWAA